MYTWNGRERSETLAHRHELQGLPNRKASRGPIYQYQTNITNTSDLGKFGDGLHGSFADAGERTHVDLRQKLGTYRSCNHINKLAERNACSRQEIQSQSFDISDA